MNLRPTFWSIPRLRRTGWALWVALLTGILVVSLLDREHTSSLTCGDFPGFYAPAQILSQQDPKSLYDITVQQRIENQHWAACFKGRFFMSVYPPFTAHLLLPLASFDAITSGYLFRMGSLVLYLAAFAMLWRLRPRGPGVPGFVSIVVLLMAPVFYGILGGQIAGPSLFLYLAIVSLLSEPGRFREFLAGVCAGLWLFKPQYGVFALAFLFFTFKPWLALGSAIPISWYYYLGHRALGHYWIAEWLRSVSDFSQQNYLSNQSQQISLPGFMQALMRWPELPPALVLLFAAFTVLACLTAAILFSIAIARARNNPHALKLSLMMLGPTITMLSPQTLFYDLTLAIVPALFFAKLSTDRSINLLLFATAVLGALTLARHQFSLPVLFIGNLACFAWVLARCLGAKKA